MARTAIPWTKKEATDEEHKGAIRKEGRNAESNKIPRCAVEKPGESVRGRWGNEKLIISSGS